VTLAESLKHFAPPASAIDPADAALRTEALEVVYAELQRLARRMLPGDAAEDVASQVAVCLLGGAPLARLSLPDTDSNARSYLAVAVRNEWIDRCRRGQRSRTSIDDIAEPAGPSCFAPGDLDDAKREALLAEARVMLYDRAVPEIAQGARGRFDRDSFGRSIEEMRELYHERTTVDAILEACDGTASTEGRNRLYQQHRRARTRLLEHLPGWLERQALTPLLATAVRNLAHAELAPRVDRGSRP
jgi:DNA-directed RNA polymerase specialized sigma24 family protein